MKYLVWRKIVIKTSDLMTSAWDHC